MGRREVECRASIVIIYENILGSGYITIACDRLSKGIFNLARMKKCSTCRLLLIIFKWISVQDNSSGWGMEGSEGRWVRQACIGRSVILSYQVYHDNRRRADQTDGRRDVRRARWGVCVWAEGPADVRVGGRVSLQSLLVSPITPPPARRQHTGARAWTDGRAGGPVRGGTRWSPAFDCTRRRRCCNTTKSSTL